MHEENEIIFYSKGQAFKKWPRLLAESEIEIETFFVLEEVDKENEILGCFKIIRNADEVKIGQLCVWPKYQVREMRRFIFAVIMKIIKFSMFFRVMVMALE